MTRGNVGFQRVGSRSNMIRLVSPEEKAGRTIEGAEQQDNNQEAGIPLKLSVNRPFFFTVIEGDSSAILMLGKIIKPTL